MNNGFGSEYAVIITANNDLFKTDSSNKKALNRQIMAGKKKKPRPHVINNVGINIAGNVDHSLIVEGDHNTVYFSTNQTPDVSYLYQLPPIPGDFTGRENEINDILDKIRLHKMSKFCLQGMGGIGKTTLALKIASTLEEQFPDAQIFLDMHGVSKGPKLTYTQAMAHVILSFHPNINLPKDEQQIVGLFRSILKSKKILLVFDNVYNSQQVEELIVDDCLIIITSRQQFALTGFDVIKLKKLIPKDARDFILRMAPRVSAKTADEIAKLLDYLPLAMRISASTLAIRQDINPNSYLNDLRTLRKPEGFNAAAERYDLDSDSSSSSQEEFLDKKRMIMKEVDASIELSYTILSEKLKKAFCLLGIFSNPFDLSALHALFGVLDQSLGIQSDMIKFDKSEIIAIVGELSQFSLIEYDHASKTYFLHNLVFSFALNRLAVSTNEKVFYYGLKRMGAYLLKRIELDNLKMTQVNRPSLDKNISAQLVSVRIMFDQYFQQGYKEDSEYKGFYESLSIKSRHDEITLDEQIALDIEHLRVAEKLSSEEDVVYYSISLANGSFELAGQHFGVNHYGEAEYYCKKYFDVLISQENSSELEKTNFLKMVYFLGRLNYKLAITFFACEVYVISPARVASAMYCFEKMLSSFSNMNEIRSFSELSIVYCKLMLGDLSLAVGDGVGAVDYYLGAISDAPPLQAYSSSLLPTIYCNIGDALGLLDESLLALEWYELAYSNYIIANNNKSLFLRIGWGFIKYGNSQKGRSVWDWIQKESSDYTKIMKYLESESLFARNKQH